MSESQELYRFLATLGIEVANLMFTSDNILIASWRFIAEENVPNLRHTNKVIGAHVMAGARIHLYRYLDRERCIATPTVVYTQPNDGPALNETGSVWGL
jgi:hypothetical protein